MSGTKRILAAGEVIHVLCRAVAWLTSSEKPEDHEDFMRVLNETWQIVVRLMIGVVYLTECVQ